MSIIYLKTECARVCSTGPLGEGGQGFMGERPLFICLMVFRGISINSEIHRFIINNGII